MITIKSISETKMVKAAPMLLPMARRVPPLPESIVHRIILKRMLAPMAP